VLARSSSVSVSVLWAADLLGAGRRRAQTEQRQHAGGAVFRLARA
jgi:hypothetical protein